MARTGLAEPSARAVLASLMGSTIANVCRQVASRWFLLGLMGVHSCAGDAVRGLYLRIKSRDLYILHFLEIFNWPLFIVYVVAPSFWVRIAERGYCRHTLL